MYEWDAKELCTYRDIGRDRSAHPCVDQYMLQDTIANFFAHPSQPAHSER